MVVDISQDRIHAKDHWKFYTTGRKTKPTHDYMSFADKSACQSHPAPMLSPSLLSSSHHWGHSCNSRAPQVWPGRLAHLHRHTLLLTTSDARPIGQGRTVNTHVRTHLHKSDDLRLVCPTVVGNMSKQVLTKCLISGFVFHLMRESPLESDNLAFLSILYFLL